MFTPDLDLKVLTRCSEFKILDKTGVDTGDGDKWSGISGLDPDDLTYAVIRIISPSGTQQDYNVLSQIPSPVTGEFWFSNTTGTNVDGLHNLVYRLKTGDFAITGFSDYGSVVNGAVAIAASAHGLVTGMYVDITGSTNYSGEKYVTKIDDSNFYITAAWNGDDGSATGTRMYQSFFYPYVWCASEAGIDKMFANIASMAPGESRKKYEDDALSALGLLQTLKSAASSSNTEALSMTQSAINRILDFYEVDANI